MKKNAVKLLATFAILAAGAQANAQDKLFKEYVYGSPYSAFANQAGYYDCSAEVQAKALCIDDVPFAGHDYTAALVFSKDKLFMLSLLAELDQERYVSTVGALAKSFNLLMLSDGSSQLDMVELAKTSRNNSEYAAKISSYESVAMNAGDITYTFFEGAKPGRSERNITDVLKNAPDNMRSAEVLIQDEYLIVRFSYPKFEAKKLQKSLSKPVESF